MITNLELLYLTTLLTSFLEEQLKGESIGPNRIEMISPRKPFLEVLKQ